VIFINLKVNSIIKKITNELVEDKLFYLLLTIVITLTTILNWNANLMEGILPYYKNFTNFILNNFQYNGNEFKNVYTWPMWGYGFILLLKYKFIIIFLQQLFSIFVIILVRIYLKINLNKKTLNFVSIIILCSLPWHFFQVSLWPYGISANLLTISLIMISIGVERSKKKYVIISAIAFGIMLNLRSDYYYFALVIGVVLVIFGLLKGRTKELSLYSLYWLSIVFITLLPWAVYTYKYSDKSALVSSNSGHVFYISLGQLPNNKWNIAPIDEDLTMRKFIDSSISTNESTLTTKSNKLLMTQFIFLIKKNPEEYFKKCIYNLKSFLINPFYLGSVHLNKNNIEKIKIELKEQVKFKKYLKAFTLIYYEFGILIVFPILSYLIGQIVLILVLISMYKSLIKIIKNGELILINLLIILVFLYQLALSIFAYYIPVYTTNIFLLLIILIGYNLNLKNSNNY
jgi:hypothetical protein